MKKTNKYDVFIDEIIFEFSKIKGFNITQTNSKGKVLFDFIVKRISDIYSYRNLFINKYIPLSLNSVNSDLVEFKKSKHKDFIKLSKEDLRENYYETIRLAYIGLFHKYENYVNDLLIKASFLISNELEENKVKVNAEEKNLDEYSKKVFDYDIRNWEKCSKTIHRVNWICNSNKHWDGYPKKKKKPNEYFNYPESEKMKLTKDDLVRDIDAVILHYKLILQLVLYIALHKMYFGENNILNKLEKTYDNNTDSVKKTLTEIEIGIKQIEIELNLKTVINALRSL